MTNLPEGKDVVLGEKTFHFSYATQLMDQLKGLAGVRELAPYDGMLFDFGTEIDTSLTSRGMFFPVEVAFLDKHGVVLQTSLLSPNYSHRLESSTKARYVIEAPVGFLKSNDIEIGTKFEIN